MANDDLFQDPSETQSQSPETPPADGADLPERLRVHTLARMLGTTSKRVIEVLVGLDGRNRSAQSTVDRSDAVRVREVLAPSAEPEANAQPAEAETKTDAGRDASEPEVVAEPEVAEPEGVAEPEVAEPEAAEPESADAIEVPPVAVAMPLFVAPQPIRVKANVDDVDDEEDDRSDDSADADDADANGDQDRPSNRRRRRGRRGRGRGRGEQGAGEGEGEDAEQPSDKQVDKQADDADGGDDGDADDEDGDDAGSGEAATRRRRRRRRRKSGGGEDSDAASPDDPPNTVVHERAPRAAKADKDSGEIQGISGSTRLEAKRQRRRDGRDAGRRRPPILTESEFLARREAVNRMMVVRDKERTEPPHQGSRYTQIAVLEDGILVEHFVTSAASASLVGNIYLGIVQNVLPSMEAAFVDIGRGRNGVLYAGEVNWEAAGLGGANRKIEQALKPGDYVVVQVSKDPVGHKGARLTTQVSLAGRYLVYVPGAASTGISRKLPDTERQRLKQILRDVVPDDAGVIIRTASEGVKEDDIRSDVTRLQERWVKIAEQAERTKGKAAGAAVALYEEPDVLVKVIRDLFNEDFAGLTVSGDAAWETITEYVNSVAPDLVSKLTKYERPGGDGPDVFAVHRIDEQLTKAMDRKVWLPSGGTLVIDRTEAMTVVDVNTGKFTGAGGNLEQTVTKNNIEAAEEIVRQLRLRDIGGMIVIDFIDMVLEANRDLVLRRLTEALARDRTRHQVSEVTSLGLVQLTRKRLGTGLVEAFSTNCQHCAGRGIVLHSDPVDNTAAMGRRQQQESGTGNRRSKRAKRPARTEEVVEPTAATTTHPASAHSPHDHPMFKAMAAANGKPEDHDPDDVDPDDVESDEELADGFEGAGFEGAEDSEDVELADAIDQDIADVDLAEDDEDLDEDVEEIDLDDDDEDDDDDVEDEDDEDEDDDVDDEDEDEDDDVDDDEDDDEDDDDDDDDEDVEDEPVPVAAPVVTGRRPRRRSAARPAGPPA